MPTTRAVFFLSLRNFVRLCRRERDGCIADYVACNVNISPRYRVLFVLDRDVGVIELEFSISMFVDSLHFVLSNRHCFCLVNVMSNFNEND